MTAADVPLAMRARLIEQAEAAVRAGDDAAARAALHVYADWLDGQGETERADDYRRALAAEGSRVSLERRPGAARNARRVLCLRARVALQGFPGKCDSQHWFPIKRKDRGGGR